MKTWLPQHSFFGDDNWAQIDAQVSILSGKEDMDDFEEYSDLVEQGVPDEVYDAAQKASDWLDGTETEDLFEEKQ